MSVEVQVREAVLSRAITEHVQSRLFTLCAPSLPEVVLDHVDTEPASARFATADDGSITFRLDVSAYCPTRTQVDAHPNAAPPGSSDSAGQIGLTVAFGMVDAKLTILGVTSDASRLPLPPAARNAIQTLIDNALRPLQGHELYDTGPIVAALREQVPADPWLARAGGVVIVGFGEAGSARSHLAVIQDWGVFLDQGAALDLLRRRLPQQLPIELGWHPLGATPTISARMSLKLQAVGIPVAGLTMTAAASLELLLSPPTLRVEAHWDLDLAGIAAPFEALARKEARLEIRKRLGNDVEHDGAQSFHADFELPQLPPVLGAVFEWRTIDSTDAGVTIGGPVRSAPAAPRGTLELSVTRFTKPIMWTLCQGVSGLQYPTVFGGAGFDNAGRLCDARVLAPNDWLNPVMGGDVDGVGFKLSVENAERITNPVRILARTARGTRLIDLGMPQIVRLPDGSVDVVTSKIDNCLRFSGIWLKIATREAISGDDLKPEPMEHPDWIKELRADLGMRSHVVTIAGLEPGELISLRSATHSLDITANSFGVATVPAVVAIGPDIADVVVERASQRPIPENARVRTAGFTWLGKVGPAKEVAVRDIDGTARIARRIEDRVIIDEFRPGSSEFVRVGGEETSLNPQPLPPEPPPESLRLARGAGITEFTTIAPLPGHDPGSLALVGLRNGTSVIVERVDGGTRVSGRWSGAVPVMHVDGGFALARRGEDIHLFAVERSEDVPISRA